MLIPVGCAFVKWIVCNITSASPNPPQKKQQELIKQMNKSVRVCASARGKQLNVSEKPRK